VAADTAHEHLLTVRSRELSQSADEPVLPGGPQPQGARLESAEPRVVPGEEVMVALILIVCLAATPDVCREEQPPVDTANAMACAVQGQLIAQEWLDEHPKWLLRGWRCRLGRAERAT
jgi:hypothetical protein